MSLAGVSVLSRRFLTTLLLERISYLTAYTREALTFNHSKLIARAEFYRNEPRGDQSEATALESHRRQVSEGEYRTGNWATV
jgi:hypothetical protein